MSKKETYEPGDILCDMHDGFRHLPDNLAVLDHTKVRTDNASEMAQAANGGKHPGNKYLVVIGTDATDYRIMAAYAYDGRYFGLVKLDYK